MVASATTRRRSIPVMVGKACLLAFWLTMMGLLVRREVLPRIEAAGAEAREAESYRAVLDARPAPGPSQMGIYWGNPLRRIGMTATRVDRVGETLQISTHTRLKTASLGRLLLGQAPWLDDGGDLVVRGRTILGTDYRLVSLSLTATLEPDLRPLARVRAFVAGERLRLVATDFTGAMQSREVPYDPRTVLSPGLTAPLAPEGMYVGRRWRERMVNPLSGRYETAVAEVTGEEDMVWEGRPTPTFVVESRWAGWTARTWVARTGEVLRQEAPMGFVLVRERAEGLPEGAAWGEGAHDDD